MNDTPCQLVVIVALLNLKKTFRYLSNSVIGSTDSRPDGDKADKPLEEPKCMFDRLGLGPPKARPECGIRRTPPWRIADGSSYLFSQGIYFKCRTVLFGV